MYEITRGDHAEKAGIKEVWGGHPPLLGRKTVKDMYKENRLTGFEKEKRILSRRSLMVARESKQPP